MTLITAAQRQNSSRTDALNACDLQRSADQVFDAPGAPART